MIEAKPSPNMLTFASIADDLVAFRRYLDDEGVDWLMFGKGELAYRETVLGGCVSVEPCKSTPLDWMHLDCLESNCRNLVVAPSKLQPVIKAQQVMVGKLHAVDETSVEYRIEAQVLQRLLDAREKLIKPEAA